MSLKFNCTLLSSSLAAPWSRPTLLQCSTSVRLSADLSDYITPATYLEWVRQWASATGFSRLFCARNMHHAPEIAEKIWHWNTSNEKATQNPNCIWRNTQVKILKTWYIKLHTRSQRGINLSFNNFRMFSQHHNVSTGNSWYVSTVSDIINIR